MTRITNLGRKRTFTDAGFKRPEEQLVFPIASERKTNAIASTSTPISVAAVEITESEEAPPPKKKRKRTKMSKRDGNAAAKGLAPLGGTEVKDENPNEGKAGGMRSEDASTPKPPNGKAAKKRKREKERKQRILTATEQRREKRIAERQSTTTCFACREKGHAAIDCPSTRKTDDNGKGKSAVGICYRCGSPKHSLARCKKSADPENPFPFASCFVCSGKGHLASACPQNKAKGVYPNGGSCKLCGDTSHLARDCAMRKNEVINTSTVVGTGRMAGADEDDFHISKRQTFEVEREEQIEGKVKKMLEVKAGAFTGTVKAFGVAAKPVIKKVVHF